MSDVTELQNRIAAALDRIGRGAEALASRQATPAEPSGEAASDAEVAALKEALEAEKMANAQLEARVTAIREKQDGMLAQLEARVARLTARADSAETEVDRLRKVNQQLRENNEALRAANAEGLADAHLINKSMQAELEALRTLRETDRSELDAIIGELTPLVEEGAHA